MKKFLLVMMALCLTFAMISCGDGGGSSSTPKVTITYDIGHLVTNGAPSAPAPVKIKKNGKLTVEQIASPVDLTDSTKIQWTGTNDLLGVKFDFEGWFVGDIEVTEDTPFSANTTISAKWKKEVPSGKMLVQFNLNYDAVGGRIYHEVVVAPGDAIDTNWPASNPSRATYTFGGWWRGMDEFTADTLTPTNLTTGVIFNLTAKWIPDLVNVTFNYNYPDCPDPVVIQAVRGQAVAARDWQKGDRGGYEFVGWFTVATATGGTEVLAATPITAATTLYARWGAQAFGTGSDFDGAERVFLENGSYAIYKFDLAGVEWENFEKVTVEIALEQGDLDRAKASGGTRGARLLGMYKPDSYAFTEFIAANPDADPPVLGQGGGFEHDYYDVPVLRMNGDTLNNYIIDNTTLYPAAITAPNTWYTLTYNVEETTLKGGAGQNHSAWNTTAPGTGEAKPALDYDGVLYVALGITRGYAAYADIYKRPTPSDGLTQWIRNVTLVPYEAKLKTDDNPTGVDPIVATPPLPAEPQFVTYIDPVVYSWRGAPTATVVIPIDPAPPQLPDAAYRLLPYPASAADVNLGVPNWKNDNNQWGWRGNGTDNEVTALPIQSIVWAKALELKFGDEEGETPIGGCQLYWQTNKASGWNSVNVSGNSGYGPSLDTPNGVTYDHATRTVTIEFAKIMSVYQYWGFITAGAAASGNAHKFGFQYYGPEGANWTDLNLISAKLIMDSPEN